MTIKDIAEAAGVSITTVSRILNNKDAGISQKTKQRVLDVIQRENYVPYAKIRKQIMVQSRLVGCVLSDAVFRNHAAYIQSLRSLLEEKGYSLVLFYAGDSAQAWQSAIGKCADMKVDGLVIARPADAGALDLLGDIPLLLLWATEASGRYSGISFDYAQGLLLLVEYLAKKGHKKIGFFLESENEALAKDFNMALANSRVEYGEGEIGHFDEKGMKALDAWLDTGIEAVVCQTAELTAKALKHVLHRYIKVPDDISLVCLEDSTLMEQLVPEITAVSYDVADALRRSVEQMVAAIEKSAAFKGAVFDKAQGRLVKRRSVGNRRRDEGGKITVVGWLNMDITLRVPQRPQIGRPVSANHFSCQPGGKGGNQAVGASMLGAAASMLGVLGNDMYGKQIYEKMMRAGVEMQHVAFDASLATGSVYINVLPNGESTVVGNVGANIRLDSEYLRQHEVAFAGAAYCLTQMEAPGEALLTVEALCRKHNVKMIVKPYPVLPENIQLLPRFIASACIVVPNEQEINAIVPGEAQLEEKAARLLEMGCRHVIVTLGENGCLYVGEEGIKWYAGEKFVAADTTGASDVFISCLAVMLAQGYTMHQAIIMANYAAGFSVMWTGVQSGIPDRILVESYLESRL